MKNGTSITTARWTLRGVLLVLLVAAVLPSLAIQAVLAHHWLMDRRQEQAYANMEVARAVGVIFANHAADIARAEAGLTEAIRYTGIGSKTELDALLTRQVETYPAVTDFLLVDPDGTVIASSSRVPPDIQVSDRPYLAEALRAGPDGWVLSDLVISRVDNRPAVIIAKPVYLDGRPVAVLLATLDLNRLREDVVTVQRAQNSSILLFDRNGNIVFRDPHVDLTYEQRSMYMGEQLAASLAGEESSEVVVSPLSGEERLVARAPVKGLGWVVGVGVGTKDIDQRVWSTIKGALLVNAAIIAGCAAVVLVGARAVRRDAASLAGHMEAAAYNQPLAPGTMHTRDFERLAVAFTRSIERREQAEAALRESEARYSSLFHNNHVAMLLIDPASGMIVDANPAAVEFYGYSREQLCSMPMTRINTLDKAEILGRMESASRQDEHSFRFQHRLSSGEIREVLVYSGPIHIEGRQLLYSIVHDISDQVRAEQALRDSEIRFRTVADTMPQLVWAARPDGYHEYFNKQWYEFTGRHEGETDGEMWMRLLHPDDYRRTLERWTYSLRTGEPYEIEYRFRRASDGQYRWFLGRALPVRESDGRIKMWLGTCTEIHEQVEQRARLAEVTEELRRSNEDLQQFAYVASHDLREPLRMVTGFMGLLKDRYGPELNDEAREFVTFAAEGAARMDELLAGLLEYSRVSTRGKAPSPVGMGEALQRALANLRRTIDETGAAVSAGELPTVLGDLTQMTQLLQNLIANAIRFGPRDGAPRVEIAAAPKDGMIAFRVSDNGIGIPPEHRDRVFVMFQRLHTRAQYEGTGIGLAVCKKIVERHGGQIWVEDSPLGGTTLGFTLPDAARREVGHLHEGRIAPTPSVR